MQEARKKENILNVPNFFTLLRVVISFLAIYFIFADFNIAYVIIFFIIGMITDAIDGQVARRFNMATEFGRKFDMIADRLLMIGIALSLVIKFALSGLFSEIHLFQIGLILTREIIATPFVFLGLISGRIFPKVRSIGKLTTVLQAIAFPAVLLSVFYQQFAFSIYLSLITGIVGAISAFYYIKDVIKK